MVDTDYILRMIVEATNRPTCLQVAAKLEKVLYELCDSRKDTKDFKTLEEIIKLLFQMDQLPLDSEWLRSTIKGHFVNLLAIWKQDEQMVADMEREKLWYENYSSETTDST